MKLTNIGCHMDTTLDEQLEKMISKYSRRDHEWVHFVTDHRAQLMRSCSTVDVPIRTRMVFKGHITQLLRRYDVPHSIMWVVMWLNGFTEHTSVTDFEQMHVLTDAAPVAELHAAYLSWQRQQSG
jgi:hypothetical protein